MDRKAGLVLFLVAMGAALFLMMDWSKLTGAQGMVAVSSKQQQPVVSGGGGFFYPSNSLIQGAFKGLQKIFEPTSPLANLPLNTSSSVFSLGMQLPGS